MASLKRYLVIKDNCCFRVSLKCRNGEGLLREDWVKRKLYDHALELKNVYGVSVYAYLINDDRAEIIGKATQKEGVSKMIGKLKSTLTQEYNRKHDRHGELFPGRFQAQNIEPGFYLLSIMACMDLLSDRGFSHGDRKYKWSSYGFYAHSKEDPLLSYVPAYLSLADSKAQRCFKYRMLVKNKAGGVVAENCDCSKHFVGSADWVEENIKVMRNEMNRAQKRLGVRKRACAFSRAKACSNFKVMFPA